MAQNIKTVISLLLLTLVFPLHSQTVAISDTVNTTHLQNENKVMPFVKAGLQVTGINAFVNLFDRWVLDADFAKISFASVKHNIEYGFVWDNDKFATNLFFHPYHGNLYFNSARSNGLSFLQSAPFAFAGSLMWETCGEREPPAVNDL
ncbi:MAG: DUF3943 domain-containing protein, partial [Bacteroidales bacterium]|nr:DUF3943 domain-containing protein [Bacteroidales bacterium]